MKRFLFAIVILLISSAAFAQTSFNIEPGNTLPAGNLVAWYPFCNDFNDRGTVGYHLLGSNLTDTTDRFNTVIPFGNGIRRSSWFFNGSNSDLHYTTTFPLVTIGGNVGYSVWIYPIAFQNAIILYNGNPNLDGMGIVMNDGTFGGGPGNQVGVLFGATNQVLSTPVTMNDWHHLVVTRTGNGFYFYVDNVQIGFYVPFAPPGFITPTTVFQLGIDNSDGTDAFLGRLDDVAIYDRFLGASDVNKLYQYSPDIVFSLGADTAICTDSKVLLPRTRLATSPLTPLDTMNWKNALYNPSSPFSPPLWYDYTWNTTPITGQSINTINFPTGIASPTVTRVLTLSRQYSCPGRDTIKVTHIVPSLNLGNDTIFCEGGAITLRANPSPGSTYLWAVADTLNPIHGDTTDTVSIIITGLYSVIKDSTFMTISGPVSCVAYDTIQVTVAPPITTTYTGSFIEPITSLAGPYLMMPRDKVLCQGGSLELKPVETYGTPTYTWSDGITTTSNLIITTSGTYWVQVTDSGCVSSDTITVNIVYDTVTVFTPDTAICAGASFVAAASSDPSISYQWTPTTGIPVSNVSTPTITADTSAWYIVTATIVIPTTSAPYTCVTRDSFYLDVQPYPSVDMGGNRNICKYDTIHITPVVKPGWYTNYAYDWSPGTFLDDSTAPNVVYTAGDTTKLILVVTTPAGCKGSDSIIIYKYNGNFASMSTDTIICPGDSVKLFPVSSEPGTTYYKWHPATYLDDSLSANPVIRPINSIEYTGIAYSQYGCKDTLTYSVVVNPAAVISMEDSVVLSPGETYQISPTTNCTYYSWFPDMGLSDTGISNPIANPPVSTKYVLTGRTEAGCVTSDSINVRVEIGTIISVPNAFTPGTGVNNTIKPIIQGIARLRYFRIYNRFGNVVFEGRNINDGWDGTFNGTPQPLGVYVYEAEAVTDRGRIMQKQGNITLLR